MNIMHDIMISPFSSFGDALLTTQCPYVPVKEKKALRQHPSAKRAPLLPSLPAVRMATVDAWGDVLPAIDSHFMRLAIAEAKRCTPISTGYSVGAVLVANRPPPLSPLHSSSLDALIAAHFTVVTTGYSRELEGNTHAEECCLIKQQRATAPSPSPLSPPSTPSAFAPLEGEHWMYTTMEPCSTRLSGKQSCSAHLLVAHVQRVVVGVREPPVFVAQCQGTRLLEDAGVRVTLMEGMEAACLQPNQHLLNS